MAKLTTAAKTLPPTKAAAQAARVAKRLIALTDQALADRDGEGWKHLSDARVLAAVVSGLCSYVAMFEQRGP